MQHVDWLERTRRLVSETFAAHGADPDEECYETLLVRNGFYCGRCFALNDFRAVWFAEENVIKFFGRNGEFLQSIAVDRAVDPNHRRRNEAA